MTKRSRHARVSARCLTLATPSARSVMSADCRRSPTHTMSKGQVCAANSTRQSHYPVQVCVIVPIAALRSLTALAARTCECSLGKRPCQPATESIRLATTAPHSPCCRTSRAFPAAAEDVRQGFLLRAQAAEALPRLGHRVGARSNKFGVALAAARDRGVRARWSLRRDSQRHR